MSKATKQIKPSKALFIKLGRSGKWERECLEKGILRFGYTQTPFDAAVAGNWEEVRIGLRTKKSPRLRPGR